MKHQLFYFHGGESYADYNKFLKRLQTKDIWDLPNVEKYDKWTKKLAQNLGSDFEVYMPQMPNSQNAKYDEWKIWFERHFEYLADGVILSGCSLGAMFLLKYVSENELPFKVKDLILMAAAVAPAGDEDCGDFLIDLNDVSVIAKRVDKVTIMHSKDDFLVPYEHALLVHDAIPGSNLVTFEDKNHFLIPEFPELIKHVKEDISPLD